MKIGLLSVTILLAEMATCQVAPAPTAPPVSYNSASELNQLLTTLQQTSQTTQLDLASLSIERWKVDSNTKRNTAADVDSIQRNLQTALPEIMGRLRSSPESLPPTFELYRNLDALYDVFSSVVESAGAFGNRDEYQALRNDLNAMESSRRAFADRMEKLTTTKENEITDLRTQLQKARAVEQATPPKKVVVDDAQEPEKPVKKKPVHKKPKPQTSSPPEQKENQQPSTPQNPQPNPQP
jgi:hypothetical protein